MAVYDYANRRTGEVVERIYLPGEDAPLVDGEWDRLFPSPRIVTADTRGFRDVPTDKQLKIDDKRVIDGGYHRDIENAKKYKAEKQEIELEKSVAAAVADYTL